MSALRDPGRIASGSGAGPINADCFRAYVEQERGERTFSPAAIHKTMIFHTARVGTVLGPASGGLPIEVAPAVTGFLDIAKAALAVIGAGCSLREG